MCVTREDDYVLNRLLVFLAHHWPLSDVLAIRVVVFWGKLVTSLPRSDPPLIHSLYISSKRVFWIVTTALVGVIGGTIASFAVAALAYPKGLPCQFTTLITL
jgi:hypothetical protein